MKPYISIVIPTCKRELLVPCLDSIRQYTDRTDIEIIVVANGYDGEEIKAPDIRWLYYPERIGCTRAQNEGIKAAEGEYVILYADDVGLLPQAKNVWIDMLLKPFLEDPKVGQTGSLMNYCEYTKRWFLLSFLVCIKASIFKKIGIMDEIFNPGGCEDTDFSIRVENAGYKNVMVPNSKKTMGDGKWVCDFPCWHKGEATVFDLPKWADIINEHRYIVAQRYCLPDGWFYEPDILEYRRLVEEIPDGGSLCELGCWLGRSLGSIADIVRRKKIKVTVVDTFLGTDGYFDDFNVEKPREIFDGNMRRLGLKPEVLHMTTDEAYNLSSEKYDLVFIDADHAYESVRNDIVKWKNRAKKLAGHDYDKGHSGVMQAVNENFRKVKVGGVINNLAGSVWSPLAGHHISVSLCTRNRYKTTLPLAMASLAMQTRKPDYVYIYDDTDKEDWIDLRTDPTIAYILNTYQEVGIGCYVIYGFHKGQHYGDEEVNKKAPDLVWRFDDDEIADPNCLLELEKAMTDDVGAVACSVEIPGQNIRGRATGKLDNIRNEPNMQWLRQAGEPEHLHSSFLYRAKVAHFDLRLSPRSFRGETMFSHEIMKKGYKLKVINNVTVWHYHEKKGGNRTPEENKTAQEMYDNDEAIFNKWMKVKDSKIFFLNNGLGDHIVFRKLLDDLNIRDVPIACCYPEIFEGFETMSLTAAGELGYDDKQYSLYSWWLETGFKGDIYQAFKKFYNL